MFYGCAIACICSLSFGCGADDSGLDLEGSANNTNSLNNQNNENNANNSNDLNNSNSLNNSDEPFVPEVEEFLVRQVASTDNFVFVPNQSDESNTVARIDGRDLSVLPIQVGQNPEDVVAAQLEGVGAVAYVHCLGSQVVAVVRADAPARRGTGTGDVRLLPVPGETNALALAPDGRHAVAYIDPEREFDASSVASLQAMGIVRLGDEPGTDQVFSLSVTRVIRSLHFTDNGELFIVGREGVNRLRLADLASDALIPKLDLGLDDSLFPPTDLEIEVASDGTFMVVRSSSFSGVAIYELPEATSQVGDRRLIELDAIPTDIDLVEDGDRRELLISIRDSSQIVRVDLDDALATPVDETIDTSVFEVATKDAGLAQITPDQSKALIYSTVVSTPSINVLDFESSELVSYPLRNRIRTLAVAPDSQTAIVVHEPDPDAQNLDDPNQIFRRLNSLTLFDIATGYRRPVVLEGSPVDILVAEKSTPGQSVVYVLLGGDDRQGVMRIDLPSFRADVVSLPSEPRSIGRVANQIFISQESEQGRLTFFDIDTGRQRTVSGYELNAEIN